MDLKFSTAHSSKLVYFEQIGSTNQYLIEKISQNSADWPDMSVVCAGEQTSGSGRHSRVWSSPSGASLSCSLLVRNPKGAAHWYGILLAMAAVTSVRSQGVEAGLKWPNDVLVEGKKLAGVLGQASSDSLVVGIGINLQPIQIDNSVSLAEIGLTQDFDFQLSKILGEFSTLRRDFDLGGVAAVLERLRKFSHTLGLEVRVTTDDTVIEGLATDIDNQGRLVINDGEEIISAGDILHLRRLGEV